jgi:CheY-like chemotaxis protein
MKRCLSCRPTILLVEEDALTRELLAHLLHLAGYEPLVSGTGERAFLLLRAWRSRIDWLCTSVALPGLVDGWILGDEFQSCQPARPTIYASPRRADLAHSGSDRVYIRHPISPIDLLLALERLSDEVGANRVTVGSLEPRAAA